MTDRALLFILLDYRHPCVFLEPPKVFGVRPAVWAHMSKWEPDDTGNRPMELVDPTAWPPCKSWSSTTFAGSVFRASSTASWRCAAAHN